MKTNTTAEQISQIIEALAKLHVQTFSDQSCDPKHNAQRNLEGKNPYVDDDTLRFHKCRVLNSQSLYGGLIFEITCSDSLDMRNTRRGFRVCYFDLFGTCVSRPDLEDAKSTRKAAEKAAELVELDLVAHYRDALKSQLMHAAEHAAELETAIDALP